ncbi:MAG TPA: 4Fe-4S dicluster domain-containing protein [Vicinamibacteria bacterium]|nr:4Fe-4S dicluster domain-containing protein [Vicinamibacteria bacterium]
MSITQPATGGRLADRLQSHTRVDVSRCYQCGKCSAGCPMAEEMDHPPSRLLRFVQTHEPRHEAALLASRAIWLCLGCETCVSRCPNDVDLPRAIDFFREQALAKGVAHREARAILAFHRAFLGSIERHGRLYELELIARYKLATGRLMQDVALAPSMFAKGKIGLLPHRISGREALARIFERAEAAAQPPEGTAAGPRKEHAS